MKSCITIFILFLFALPNCFSQNNRVNDFNNINWIQFFGTKKINKKTAVQLEYQWRRTDGLKNGQQGLLRTLFLFQPNNQLSFGLGYAEVETYTYGDYPIASAGRFPEHRIFEQAILKQQINNVAITNRFRIEQRWLGKIKSGTNREIEDWTFLHRFRYLLKIQKPLYKNLYAWVGDELFIGAGKNLGFNIFDQNRLHMNVGLKINPKVNIEFGYLNQVLQQGRLIDSKAIMQRNSGCLLAASLSL